MSDSDTVYHAKKSMGYARFFLKVGKRSDAQNRLKHAMAFVEGAARAKMTVDNETIELMKLTEEISALWQETLRTIDPPGSSFVLAKGDEIHLARPGREVISLV